LCNTNKAKRSGTDPTKHGYEEEFEDNQRGNQNPYIEEEQITQWSKEKVQRTNNDLLYLYCTSIGLIAIAEWLALL
jgi:hypothetical protein